MARATWILAATTTLGVAASIWLYLDNRSLRSELDDRAPPLAATPTEKAVTPRAADPWTPAEQVAVKSAPGGKPALPEQNPTEARMGRRAQRTAEFGAMFGRGDGETEDEYRARIVPMIKAGLALPRARAEEMRKIAEEKAHVTRDQSAKLDKAFDKVYGDVLDYTNKAITDGQLSPYERNVAGWLDYAGGLGGILNDAQGQIGKILEPGQMRAMYDSGFEWGEYLGLEAPWEKLKPPPPPKPAN
jgi:hypothetical protein